MRARVIWVVVLALGITDRALPQAPPDRTPPPNIQILSEAETLKGLSAACVQVEEVENAFEKLGVTRRKIKADVESKLEEAGIRVASSGDCLMPPFLPYVRVVLMGLPIESSLYAAFLSLDLREPVTLNRRPAEPTITYAVVWEKNMLLVLSPDKVPTLRTKVGELLDKFLDDYRKANPSRRGQKLLKSGRDNP